MINIARPYIGEEEKKAVMEVLESGLLAQGPVVERFEKAFAEYCGVSYAIATSSGTTALHLALLAHGIGPGDEVITSPFSFIATANAVRHAGATPVFADIDPVSFNLDPFQVETKITANTRAIMPVHLFGNPADMENYEKIARKYNLVLIEDACQAHGAEFKGRKVGSFGTGCFSFYPTKNITSAEGGMITTNDFMAAERARMLRHQGMKERYYHKEVGYNFRMTDIHAAIGLTQLNRLESFIAKRRENAAYLTQKLDGVVTCPEVNKARRHVFNQFTIRVEKDRDKLSEKLLAAGVGNMVYYPVPIHRQEPYIRLGYASTTCPVAEMACQQVLSLPVHPQLSSNDLAEIAGAVIHLITN